MTNDKRHTQLHAIYHYLRVVVASLVLCLTVESCHEETIYDDSYQISFDTSVQDNVNLTRATIFENNNDILNDAEDGKGGGKLTMYAYMTNIGRAHINGSQGWYFEKEWRFYNSAENKFFNHYWPQGSLDFFAYMPWKDSPRQKNIDINSYKVGTGLTITCETKQPADLKDTNGQETIIAYTANRSKENGVVPLYFVHPFAAVSFELKQAHRNLTINWIRFNNVYLTGTTTLNATTESNTQISWTGTPPTSTFEIPVGKTIPDQINFGAKIGGPYLVMPQNLASATITINYDWDNQKDVDDTIEGDEDTNTNNEIYQIKRSLTGEWLAGKKYNYVLNLGDNQEEILFKVEVEPWEVTGGDNNIFDVE